MLGQDSAAAVYKVALDHLKVDLAGVPESAYGAVLAAMPKPSATPLAAADSATVTNAGKFLADLVPNLRPLVIS